MFVAPSFTVAGGIGESKQQVCRCGDDAHIVQ